MPRGTPTPLPSKSALLHRVGQGKGNIPSPNRTQRYCFVVQFFLKITAGGNKDANI